MARSDRAVILATHSMVEAETLCHRVAFIRRGQIVAAGPIDELRATIHPGRRVDMAVHGSGRMLRTALRLVARVDALEVTDEDDHQRVRCVVDDGPGVVDEVLRAVMATGGEIIDCRIAEASLEDLFVRTLQEPAAAPRDSVA